MSEWFKVYVSKTYVGVFLPWVRIPLSSPKGEKMERKKFLKKNIIIFIIAVITIIVVSVIIIDIPFQVSKVMVISNRIWYTRGRNRRQMEFKFSTK